MCTIYYIWHCVEFTFRYVLSKHSSLWAFALLLFTFCKLWSLKMKNECISLHFHKLSEFAEWKQQHESHVVIWWFRKKFEWRETCRHDDLKVTRWTVSVVQQLSAIIQINLKYSLLLCTLPWFLFSFFPVKITRYAYKTCSNSKFDLVLRVLPEWE